MRRLAWIAPLLLASAVQAQTIEIHIHIHLDADRSTADAKVVRKPTIRVSEGESVEYLGQVLDGAVMMTLDDDAALKAKLPPIKARVYAVKPRTNLERRGLDALKARIRRYERVEPSEPDDDDNDDKAGVAAG